MGKASVIIYVTVSVLILFLVSLSPKEHSHHRRHRRLKLRSSSPDHHDPVAFDPLVAELEHKQWESHSELEDYLNDDDKFNVTTRLLLLFPQIDVNPADGFISEAELTDWNLQLAEREVMYRTQRDLQTKDKNHDGFLSFHEYEPPTWVRHSDDTSFGYDMGWWKEEHFNASDFDGDGRLNLTEFKDFLHPSDSKNPELRLWLCKEEVRERDKDKDGKVSFEEFFPGLFDLVRNDDDDDEEVHNSSLSGDSRQAAARRLFAELDKDSDGFLSDMELLPIIEKLHPSEHYYAKRQTDHIMSQADSNKDGRLTLAEMMENQYAFYSAMLNEDEDYDEYHDEFR